MKKPSSTKPSNAPATLSRPARDLWRKYVARYAIDDVHGLFLLEQAMAAFDRMNEAAAAVARNGAVKLDRFGMPRAHPSLVVERDAPLEATLQ